MNKMKRVIIVVGGAGFIGLHLVNKLLEDENNQVTIIDNLSASGFDDSMKGFLKMYPTRLNFIYADITQYAFAMLPLVADEIYHLAATIGSKDIKPDPHKILIDNLEMMLWVIQTAKLNNIPKVLFVSTIESQYMDDPLNPRWIYAFSKLACEVMLSNSGINYRIARLSNVYGPRTCQNYVFKSIIKRIQAGENPLVITNANDTREFVYVADIVDGLIKLMNHYVSNSLVTLIGNTPILISDLAKEINRLMKSNVKIKTINNKNPDKRFTRGKLKIDFPGWEPKTSLKEGLKETIKFYA